jgi:signal transduction histidine kinase/ActR/RegA family two-component response regulator
MMATNRKPPRHRSFTPRAKLATVLLRRLESERRGKGDDKAEPPSDSIEYDPFTPDPESAEVRSNRLAHSARLATIGEIAAAVAHEINNPLQFLSVSLDELRRELARELPGHRGAEGRALLDDALEAVKRIRSISVELLPFARSTPGEVQLVDLNKVVMRAVRMVRNEARHRAELVCDLGELPGFSGDAQQLAQLCTNLLLNASQAIEEGHADQNRIVVTTRALDGKVRLTIEDTGCGIPAHHLERIYERFFTTKPAGQGTGIGMSVCREIILGHGGTIHVESEVGKGTLVTVELPAAAMRSLVAPHSQMPPPPVRDLRMLVVDDDLLVLKSYRRALGKIHRLVFASDGEDALAILRSDRRFDVILCDLMMPTMDGPRFYDELSVVAPELRPRVLFCSGGAFTQRADGFIKTLDVPILHKPISIEDLQRAISRVIATVEGTQAR